MASLAWESTIINAPLADVWALVRPLDFAFWADHVEAPAEGKEDSGNVGGLREISYKDGTKQTIQLRELSDIDNVVGWEIIASEPAIQILSSARKIQLRRVTATNSTFVEYTAQFSADAGQDHVQDAAFKAKEFFKALQAAVAKQ